MEKNLSPNEEIVLKAKIHWYAIVPGLVIALIAFSFLPKGRFEVIWKWTMYHGVSELFYAIPDLIQSDWKLITCVVFIIYGLSTLLRGLTRMVSLKMAITNQRVLKKYGLASASTEEIYLRNISSIEIEQPFLGTLLGYGWVYFESPIYGTTIFPMVTNPTKIRNAALAQAENLQVFN